MGKREADIDGIKHYWGTDFRQDGSEVYIVPCERCGKEFKRMSYGRKLVNICNECRYGIKQQHKYVEDELYKELTTQGERRFKKAVECIKKQVKDMRSYVVPIAKAKTAQEKYGSVPEAMVAVELLRLGYRVIPQQKINKYKVDFYLPDEKIVIEVDGEIYHNKKKQSDREAIIQFTLGWDAQIIHIPAELISKDIRKLSKCINIRRNQGT